MKQQNSLEYDDKDIKPTIKRKELYKDIVAYIEMRLDLMQASTNLSTKLSNEELQKYQYMIEQNQKKINQWLEEEVCTK